jgi:ribosomal protein L37AE/L43A
LNLTRDWERSASPLRPPFSFDFRWTSSDLPVGFLGLSACTTREGDITATHLVLPHRPSTSPFPDAVLRLCGLGRGNGNGNGNSNGSGSGNGIGSGTGNGSAGRSGGGSAQTAGGYFQSNGDGDGADDAPRAAAPPYAPSVDLVLPLDSVQAVVLGGPGATALEIAYRDPESLVDAVACITVEQTMGRPLAAAGATAGATAGTAAGAASPGGSARPLGDDGGEDLATVTCPHCGAESGVTGLEATPQWYCAPCGTVFAAEGVAASTVFPGSRTAEAQLRQCEVCGMLGPVEAYPVMYVYFFLILYAMCWGTSIRCPGCFLRKAWAMLLLNVPLVIGLPNAIMQLTRVRADLTPRAGADLAIAREQEQGQTLQSAANLSPATRDADTIRAMGRLNHRAVTAGAYGDALGMYQAIRARYQHSAPAKFNTGMLYVRMGDLPAASQWFRAALRDCANHVPALQMLEECHARLHEAVYVSELRERYALYMGGAANDGEIAPQLSFDDLI